MNHQVTAYQQLLTALNGQSRKLKSKDYRISILRLICISSSLLLMYQYVKNPHFLLLVVIVLLLAAFGLIINYHQSVRWNIRFLKERMDVNQKEVNFLEGNQSQFANGEDYITQDHPYSFDLDFFGENSLYQSINRTTTVAGKKRLADVLLHAFSNEEILNNQQAIKELRSKLGWRQTIGALGQMNPDSEESFEDLLRWSQQKPLKVHSFVRLLSFLTPAITLTVFAYYLITSSSLAGSITGLLFLINLGFLGAFSSSIKKELVDTTKIEKILKQYAFMLQEIEQQSFESVKLQSLQSTLQHNGRRASDAIRQLALLFGRMEHVANIFASPLLNGSILFHVHVLIGLNRWRTEYGQQIAHWLDVIGEVETLNSFGNFSYNNPDFIFPDLNEEYEIKFEDLGHPLLSKDRAVTNSIHFNRHRFFILTGSNMSGKSTFLRTVGVNMILAGIGAPIFASGASIHPLPVHVSMRLADSLTDSESYFYAEVKRLKAIMQELDERPCFVLLDEILRGTNSDDKRDGTIEVIRKMASKKAFGGIATHDLEVCKTTQEYPDILINKRFEVEIINDELRFDYLLRDGICQNKSASFIMKKMGVI